MVFLGGRLVELQWLVGGVPVSSSWSNPRRGFAESLLDMTLEPRHAGEELTCRIVTARGRRLPGRGGAQQRLRDAVGRSGANITDLSTVILLKCKIFLSESYLGMLWTRMQDSFIHSSIILLDLRFSIPKRLLRQ